MDVRNVWTIVKRAANACVDDDALTLGAALAFYTTLAMTPLLLCRLAIAGLAGSRFETELAQQVSNLVDSRAAEALATT